MIAAHSVLHEVVLQPPSTFRLQFGPLDHAAADRREPSTLSEALSCAHAGGLGVRLHVACTTIPGQAGQRPLDTNPRSATAPATCRQALWRKVL